MSDYQKQMIVRWFEEVWNKGRREAIDEMLLPETVIHDGETDTRGPEEFKPFFDRIYATFSGMRFTTHEVISEGDYTCARWSAAMRHTGDGLGVPPTGRAVGTTGMTLIRFHEGKFAEAWQNWDMLGLIRQMTGVAAPRGVYIAGR